MAGSYSPQSGVRGVHIRQDLGNLSIGYHPTGMIAEQVFPVFPVTHESDMYWFWDKGQAFNMTRSDGNGSIRADGTASKELSFGATKKTYNCDELAYKTKITDREARNADSSLRLEVSKTRRVQDILLLEYETRVAALVTNATNYATANKVTNAGVTQWNNGSFVSQNTAGQSAIMAQLLGGIDAVRQSTGGRYPNVIIIPAAVLAVMRNDKGLNDSVKYTSNTLATGNPFGESLAGLKMLVPTVMSQAVTEGEATALGDVWGKNVVIAYVNPNPGIDDITLGLTFRQRPWQVKQWREEQLESTFYEPSMVQDEAAVTFDCAYLIAAAIA